MRPDAKRIGEGHRRQPGDVVAGPCHSECSNFATLGDHEVIGRVVYAGDTGCVLVETDDGRCHGFTPREACRLVTIQEVDGVAHRDHNGILRLISEAA